MTVSNPETSAPTPSNPLSRIPWLVLAEVLFVIVFTLITTIEYQNFDPAMRLRGGESENVAIVGQFLETSWEEHGYVPYWFPDMSEGSPTTEDAYAYLFNPVAFYSTLAFGHNNSIKLTIIVHFAISGLGGQALAWTMGWGRLGRLTLAALLVLFNPMQASTGIGFYQLGIAQAYLPWALAAALLTVYRQDKRWPPVLLAVSLALLFFCGTVYYVLPALVSVGLVALIYGLEFRRSTLSVRPRPEVWKRFFLAGAICAGLVAVQALNVAVNFRYVGDHPPEDGFFFSDTLRIFQQFFDPRPLFENLFAEFTYVYLIPAWFALLIFIVLPPSAALHRPAGTRFGGRLLTLILVGLVLFFLWGSSFQPIVPWLYANIPLLGQWRMPQRILSMAVVFAAMLVAYRVDALHRGLLASVTRGSETFRLGARRAISLLLVGAVILAVWEVYGTLYNYGSLEREFQPLETCLQWLKQAHPDEYLVTDRNNFRTVNAYVRQEIRLSNPTHAYDLNGMPATLGAPDLTDMPSPYWLHEWDDDPTWQMQNGLFPVVESPIYPSDNQQPCVWTNPTALPFTWAVRPPDLPPDRPPALGVTLPVTFLARSGENIWLRAQPLPDSDLVVVAGDIAYPGWVVSVNGQPAKLESVGMLLGVVLPPGDQPALITFSYTAPLLKIGGLITLVTSVLTAGYLLRAEGWRSALRSWRVRRAAARAQAAERKAAEAIAAANAPPPALAVPVAPAQTVPTQIIPAAPVPVRPAAAPVLPSAPSTVPTPPAPAPQGRALAVVDDNGERRLRITVPLPSRRDAGTVGASMLTALFTTLLVVWFKSRRSDRD